MDETKTTQTQPEKPEQHCAQDLPIPLAERRRLNALTETKQDNPTPIYDWASI